MNNLTFDDALDEMKSSGTDEKRTIEVANELARIVGSLAEARVKSGLTQRQLAEKCGIKQSAIARMESLQAIPRLDTMIRIARSLNVKINVDSSSSNLVKAGFIIDMSSFTSNQYLWHYAMVSSPSVSCPRKEPAYATFG